MWTSAKSGSGFYPYFLNPMNPPCGWFNGFTYPDLVAENPSWTNTLYFEPGFGSDLIKQGLMRMGSGPRIQ